MAAGLRNAARDERGFTIVELLVVTVIIGLLAAIAIPSFLAQREKARDADAKSAARAAALAIESYGTERGGDYGGATPALLQALEPALTGAPLAVVLASGQTYELTVTSPSGNVFGIERRPDGNWRLECSNAGSAGCPATGRWD